MLRIVPCCCTLFPLGFRLSYLSALCWQRGAEYQHCVPFMGEEALSKAVEKIRSTREMLDEAHGFLEQER